MEQVAYFAASGRMAQRNVRVGQPLDQVFAARGRQRDGRRPATRRPRRARPARRRGRRRPLPSSRRPTWPASTPPGSARRWPGELAFAANPDPAESDPSRADAVDALGPAAALELLQLGRRAGRSHRRRRGRPPGRAAPGAAAGGARPAARRDRPWPGGSAGGADRPTARIPTRLVRPTVDEGRRDGRWNRCSDPWRCRLGAAPAGPGEELTPYLRFERPWSQGLLLLVLAVGDLPRSSGST